MAQKTPQKTKFNHGKFKSKECFPTSYCSLEQVEKGMSEGSIIKGNIRIMSKDLAFVTHPEQGIPDIVIEKAYRRHRSLNGDVVAVKINENKDTWKVKNDVVLDHFKSKSKLTEEDSRLEKLAIQTQFRLRKLDYQLPLFFHMEYSEDDVKTETWNGNANEDNLVSRQIPQDYDQIPLNAVNTIYSRNTSEMRPITCGSYQRKSPAEPIKILPMPEKESSSLGSGFDHGALGKETLMLENTVMTRTKFKVKDDKRADEKQCCEKIFNLSDVLNHPDWRKFVQKSGKVVYIFEKKHQRMEAGFLKIPVSLSQPLKYLTFQSFNSTFPLLQIYPSPQTRDIFSRPNDFKEDIFLGKICTDKWDKPYVAIGEVQRLGNKNNIHDLSKGIMKTLNLIDEDYSTEALDCLHKEGWTIPSAEINRRSKWDFRKDCVFTIDPKNARDLDDALSIRVLRNDSYEVCVHIADVSYFVEPNSPLDQEAKQRCNSVYLVERMIPMLPRRLCEDLCSLSPNEDRLTLSVKVEITKNGDVLSQEFGQSIIRSCCKLSYEQAKEMIKNEDPDSFQGEMPSVENPWTIKEVHNMVRILSDLSKKLRLKRYEKGAICLNTPELDFTLDDETGLPKSFHLRETEESHFLIEEYMILANNKIAEFIKETFPNLAFLRGHPPPTLHKTMSKVMKRLDFPMDYSSNKTLAITLNDLKRQSKTPQGKAKYHVFVNLVNRTMNLAQYYCNGALEKSTVTSHYALALDSYTHFTSPIRRYPDIIVHRLLKCVSDDSLSEILESSELKAIAKKCNEMKLLANKASLESEKLFLSFFVHDIGSFEVDGVVCGVQKSHVDVYAIDVAQRYQIYPKTLFPQQLTEKPKSYEIKSEITGKGAFEVKLKWKDNNPLGYGVSHLRVFTQVKLLLKISDKKCLYPEIEAVLLKPEKLQVPDRSRYQRSTKGNSESKTKLNRHH